MVALAEHITTNAPGVADFFQDLAAKLEAAKTQLLNEIGTAVVKNVKHRIQTNADGSWQRPSKWTRAKKATQKVLQGTDKYIKFRISKGKLEIYGDMPADWTFSQHEKGFVNRLYEQRELNKGRVRIEVKDPAPLGLPHAGRFEFVPKKAGITPGRRIWSNQGEVQAIVQPIFPRWIKGVIAGAGTTVKATP